MKRPSAEDDLTSRTMLVSLTRNWRYEPVAIENGEAAWKIMQEKNAPRLLLLDGERPILRRRQII